MKHKINTLEEYKDKTNEEFYNPFEKTDIDIKPSHIADKGGMMKLRKEIFNISRVEYSKRPNGDYTVLAKTQFAKGEIVEISPVIIVGVEAKAVPRLKDYIFEIDKKKQQYGVVLGYGSLYRHNQNSNIVFAYNKANKQMYFMSAQAINAGAELTIDYGKDYWDERTGFGEMAPIVPQAETPTESTVVDGEIEEGMGLPQNANDITGEIRTKQFGEPPTGNPANMNPAVTGIAIKGLGQQ